MLLFHGSRNVNWLSILKKNLLLNVAKKLPGVRISGKMFGSDAVYFAESSSKSIGYCDPESSNREVCLMVVEVIKGKELELFDADYNIDDKIHSMGYDSVWAHGYYGNYQNSKCKEYVLSSESKCKENIVGDVKVFNDKIQSYDQLNKNRVPLWHNEHIVYNKDSFIFRYMIHLKV
jgi:hypothetical protein